MNGRTLWYIVDPMCSWCWGFSPVIEKIRHEYGERMTIKLVAGGLRPGTTEPLAPEKRAEILHHWHNVQRITEQPFKFEGAMPHGFIYDTEPACRTVVSASLIDLSYSFPLLAAIQYAFYVEEVNVTQTDALTQLAAGVDIPAAQFSQMFASDTAKESTQNHFRQAAQWGVRGFPSIIAQDAAGYRLLTNGYCPVDLLRQRINAWLEHSALNSGHILS